MEFAFAYIEIQFIFQKSTQNLAYLFDMLTFVFADDIIQIFANGVVYEALKRP
jgi:hypothetical protein